MSYNISFTPTTKSRLEEVDFENIPFGRVMTDHMFEMDYRNGSWTNMRIRPVEKLSIHPSNLALHYGQSIFEGMKASKDLGGTPLLIRPEMHARRLNLSAERMCMPTIPEDLFVEAVSRLVSIERDWIPRLKGSSLYIRPIFFAADEFLGVASSETYKFIILTLPVGPYYAKPVSLWAEQKYVRAVAGGTGEAKTAGNYAASLLPAKLAKEKGYDQVMWMDAHEFKYIQEVGTMNLFFVFKDKIVTPATDGAILKGITRDCFIQILKHWGHRVEERPISIDEVLEAYENNELVEVFGSGTAAVSTQVAKITYRDTDMTFEKSAWELSLKLKNYLNELRSGDREDPFGWIIRIDEDVMV